MFWERAFLLLPPPFLNIPFAVLPFSGCLDFVSLKLARGTFLCVSVVCDCYTNQPSVVTFVAQFDKKRTTFELQSGFPSNFSSFTFFFCLEISLVTFVNTFEMT